MQLQEIKLSLNLILQSVSHVYFLFLTILFLLWKGVALANHIECTQLNPPITEVITIRRVGGPGSRGSNEPSFSLQVNLSIYLKASTRR